MDGHFLHGSLIRGNDDGAVMFNYKKVMYR